MNYWLLKSDPGSYSWDHLVKDGRSDWNGVRNHQAANNLRAMKRGDRALFYHSGTGPAIVGIVEIAKASYPDPTDAAGRFVTVDIVPLAPASRLVPLAAVKAAPGLKDMALLRQSRLSVQPVTPAEWQTICAMAGIPA
jgi:predicted RNA-binding protein with PUA-like domain